MHDLNRTFILKLQGETKNRMSNNLLLGFRELFFITYHLKGDFEFRMSSSLFLGFQKPLHEYPYWNLNILKIGTSSKDNPLFAKLRKC